MLTGKAKSAVYYSMGQNGFLAHPAFSVTRNILKTMACLSSTKNDNYNTAIVYDVQASMKDWRRPES